MYVDSLYNIDDIEERILELEDKENLKEYFNQFLEQLWCNIRVYLNEDILVMVYKDVLLYLLFILEDSIKREIDYDAFYDVFHEEAERIIYTVIINYDIDVFSYLLSTLKLNKIEVYILQYNICSFIASNRNEYSQELKKECVCFDLGISSAKYKWAYINVLRCKI